MSCPIIGYSINERGARVVAGLVATLVAATLLLPETWARSVLLFLALDFGFRAFSRPRWSPLGRLGELALGWSGIAPRRVDAGPKRFAARIGLGFVLGLLAATGYVASGIVAIASGVLILFALLESVFGFCVGCRAWTLWYRLLDALQGRK